MAVEELPVFPFGLPHELEHHPRYEELRSHCPVPKVRLARGGGEAYLVTRHQDARRIFSDPVFSRQAILDPDVPALLAGSKIPDLLQNVDPPVHTRLRKLVVAAFTTGAVARLRPRIQAVADELIDEMLAEGAPADFISRFGTPYPARVICMLLGVPRDAVEQVVEWMFHILSVDEANEAVTAKAFEDLAAYCAGLISERRRKPEDDLITRLIHARDDEDRLSEDELLRLVWLLLGAGFETTANMIANCLLTFGHFPDQWQLLLERPELVPGAVDEILRYVPIAHAGFERMATVDTELSGVPVPAGSVVLPVLASINFDTAVCPDPTRFDVTRPHTPHLGFGFGPHRCVGSPLALLELEIGLATLLRRLPGLRLAVPETELEWKQGVAVRAMVHLPVTW